MRIPSDPVTVNGEPAANAIVRKNEKVQSVLIREPGNLLRQNDEISSEESNSSELKWDLAEIPAIFA